MGFPFKTSLCLQDSKGPNSMVKGTFRNMTVEIDLYGINNRMKYVPVIPTDP